MEKKHYQMRELISTHSELKAKIAELTTQQNNNTIEVLKQIVNDGEFRLLSINWNRVIRYYR